MADEECECKEGYVRIKLVDSAEKPDNRANGFYILMTNGNTYSDVKNEFVVEKKFLPLLEKENVDYTIV